MIDYSIIVPAYNEAELLPQTLACLSRVMAEIDTFRGNIIVTDNASTDATAAVAQAAGATVVFEPHRQIARSRNAGAAAATGRFLIFVDADTLISRRLLEQSLGCLEHGNWCGGGTVLDSDAVRRQAGVAASRLVQAWNVLGRLCNWACGAYVFCRRDAFEAVGGFDERFYASEEIHLCRALQRWARQHHMQFGLLDVPIETSSRKFEWYTWRDFLRWLTGIAWRPSRLRTRAACDLWYQRPQ